MNVYRSKDYAAFEMRHGRIDTPTRQSSLSHSKPPPRSHRATPARLRLPARVSSLRIRRSIKSLDLRRSSEIPSPASDDCSSSIYFREVDEQKSVLSLRPDRYLYEQYARPLLALDSFRAGSIADDCSSSIYSRDIEDEEPTSNGDRFLAAELSYGEADQMLQGRTRVAFERRYEDPQLSLSPAAARGEDSKTSDEQSLSRPATAAPSDPSSGADEGSQQVRDTIDEEASTAHCDHADDHMQKSGLGIHCPHFLPNPHLNSDSNYQLGHTTHNNINSLDMKQQSPADSVLDLSTEHNMSMTAPAASTAELTTLETFSTDALLVELARRQPKDDSQVWAEVETPRGAWAFPNEAGLSETAVACAELAATGARRMGLCPATMNGEDTEEFEVEVLKRKIEAIKCTLRKTTEGCHRVMRPTLYTDIGLDGLIAEMAILTTAMRDQRRPQALIDGTVTPKPQRHCNPKELPNTETIWVDTKKGIADMVDMIMEWVNFLTTSTYGTPLVAKDEPLLAIDIEAVQLGRHGDISIIQICLTELNACFLIDVFTLREAAFYTPGNNIDHGITTLAFILADASVKKLLFDCRTDNDALTHIYPGVKLHGIIDVQLMFSATRTEPKTENKRTQVQSLAYVAPYTGKLNKTDAKQWKSIKNWGKAALVLGGEKAEMYKADPDLTWADITEMVDLAAKKGYVWCNERPLSKLAIDYCAQDVVFLKHIYQYCIGHEAWNPAWEERVKHETLHRLRMAEKSDEQWEMMEMRECPVGWAEIEQVSSVTGEVVSKKK